MFYPLIMVTLKQFLPYIQTYDILPVVSINIGRQKGYCNFINNIRHRRNRLKNGLIDKATFIESVARYGKTPYGLHLKNVADGMLRY